ncbi:MAG TPA: molybdenum cofactor biosynthesis protein MoaE [Vicinamibacterales bacterium]|mgnify:FL=1|nr:molybdenum cofactor biosynthesis protein MoaE [Acidobacteriota bacterium]HOC17836.1 molybdenum cofactor biosynthesis protein MoaE [Vicinamibacterales bacterium]
MSDRQAAIVSSPLDAAEVVRLVTSDEPAARAGAIVTFIGTVRGDRDGRRVAWLDYEAYDEMAVRVFRGLLEEAREHWPAARAAVHHRTGRVLPGEASVVIAASAPHRAEAFAACRYLIERIKQVAPVWKRECFEDGASWVEGAVADPADPEARGRAYERACR